MSTAVDLLRLQLNGESYPPPGVPDTPENRQLWDDIARDLAEMERQGIHPELPAEWEEMPEEVTPATIGLASQLDFGWTFNPAEQRNARGEWSKTGAGYVAPDHARLISPRGRPPDPADHPFFKANPVSPANVTKVYDASTSSERTQGMRWYADAHTLAAAIGRGDTVKGASLLASYSPQTNWPVNMFNAARAMDENRALGPGDGMITRDMQANAQESLDGKSIEENFGQGAPKIKAFAHLIADGGDAPEDQLGQVVVDRHAMSVAMGKRLPKKDADKAPIGADRYYQHVADTYRQAALEISRRDGIKMTPHQLQAITWLHQQAANEAQDAADAQIKENRLARGRQVSLGRQWERWNKLAGQEKLPVESGTTALSVFDQLYDIELSGDE